MARWKPRISKDGPGHGVHAPQPDGSHPGTLSGDLSDVSDEAAFAKAVRLPGADSRVMGNRTLALVLCAGSFVLFGMSNALPVLDHGLEGHNLRFLGMVDQYWTTAHYGVASVIALATTVLPVCQLVLLLLALQPDATPSPASAETRGGMRRSLSDAIATRPVLPFAKWVALVNVVLVAVSYTHLTLPTTPYV